MSGLLRLLRTSTFRLASTYMALFGGSAIVLLAFFYWATAGSLLRQSDATIDAEVTGLAEQYRQRGTGGVATIIRERVQRDPSSPSLYIFADARFRPLAGNLSAWPNVKPESGWVEFRLEDRARGNEVHRARARVFALRGGAKLLVGRDMFEIDRLRARFVRATLGGLGVIVLLALVGGVTMSRSTVRRIEAINQTSRQIMDGDLGQRVPTDGTGDEFDRLASNLNHMLDRIEMLMDGVRRVSDHIAHDLRTPLARVRGRLERLHAALESKADTEACELAAESLEEADRLLRVFRALLRIARIEAGGERAPDQRFDLAAVARDAVELYDAAAEAKDQQLILVEGQATPVRGDRDLVFQALTNLLDNAIKYTPERGVIRVTASSVTASSVTASSATASSVTASSVTASSVTASSATASSVTASSVTASSATASSATASSVTASSVTASSVTALGDGLRARVAVVDSGPGIPETERQAVTERFARLDRDRRLPGEGLGLALVAAIALHHGGSLRLDDANPGLVAELELPAG